MRDLFRLDGKVAVVVGGAGGLGEAIALGLGFFGARVVLSSRNLERLQRAAKTISEATGSDVLVIPADVTREESVGSLASEVVGKFGAVDILVNAHGLNLKRPALEFDMEEWDTLFAVNVRGVMLSCREFGKVMAKSGGGKIINLSSVRGKLGHPSGNCGYCATKGAVDMITRALACEWAPYRINVNAVAPALVATEGTREVMSDPERVKRNVERIPLGRLGMPQDVVGACVFLASAAADFVTGQVIYVDGGLTACG